MMSHRARDLFQAFRLLPCFGLCPSRRFQQCISFGRKLDGAFSSQQRVAVCSFLQRCAGLGNNYAVDAALLESGWRVMMLKMDVITDPFICFLGGLLHCSFC